MLTYSCTAEPEKRVRRVQFYVPSPDEIRKQSVVEITETAIYNRGLPAPGGLSDTRMGTVDRRLLCATCGLDVLHCQGHSGHIEFPFPMYHSIFFETVLKTLRCVCFMCSRLCLSDEDVATLVDGACGKQRLIAVYQNAKMRKRCPHCSVQRPSFVRCAMSIRVEWPGDMAWESDEERQYCTQPFTQRDALSILANMTDDDCQSLGFDPVHSHPKHMVMETLLVPPPSVRPTIMASEGSKTRGQDDLTQKLQDIGKRCHDLRACMGQAQWRNLVVTNDALDKIQRLQYEVFTLVNNTVRGQRPSVQRSGVPTKSYIGRIKGKDGRIRGNLMGKRVDFCARCVISPGPFLDLDQVGVPESICTTLTVPELVTEFNRMELTRRVRLGAGAIGGAEAVITNDDVVIQLAQCTAREKLVLLPGWTVERYLKNDDVVAFNRQPSLHKQGLMGHRVLVVDGMTFRMNLSVTAPYNADFDGDEMNLHVPQSMSARASVSMLMMVTDQIVSPQANKPCMGIVQDSLVGLYRMTHVGVLLSHADACHIVCEIKHRRPSVLMAPALVVSGTPYWTGKQLVSSLLPTSLNIDRESASTMETMDVSKIIIHNGQVLSGQLNKSCLGSASGGIIDVVYRQEGGKVAAHCISDLQRIALAYNAMVGFSVGLSDCVLDPKGSQLVGERISAAKRLADEITHEIGHEDVTPENVDLAEKTIRRILSKALMQAGSIVEQSFPSSNAIRNMVMSGSKGSPINLSQIGACVGQQSVEGRRIVAEKGSRTLPCFAFGERSLACQGFVQSSYVQGLSPSEFFFHAMGGREGLVDTAVKTSETGYIQRRQIKAMESHSVRYDGTVRNASDDIVQFRYAGRGYEPSKLERVVMAVLTMSSDEVRKRLPEERDHRRVLMLRAKILPGLIVVGQEVDTRMTLPFHPQRLRMQYLSTNGIADADSAAAADEFIAVADELGDPASALALAYEFPAAYMRQRPSREVRALAVAVARLARGALVSAGEMVGCIAAQSIGEPTTQMTLNSVDWKTTLAVRWTAKAPPPCPTDAEVGAWIDALIETMPEKCQVQPDGRTIYLPLPPGTARALSPDSQGRMVWTNVEAVTRHPPINEDGSNTLVEVSTASGRTVVVTKGKSLLVERGGELVQVGGGDVAIGDRVPVGCSLPEDAGALDLRTVFSPTEAIFTDVAIEALRMAKTDKNWFHTGKFEQRCCYARGDSLLRAAKHQKGLLEPQRVRLLHGGTFLPQDVPLDHDFGFFVGAYLAKGSCTKSQVHIENIDSEYRREASEWCLRNGVQGHEPVVAHRQKSDAINTSIVFHSTMIASLLTRTCGHSSRGMRVPAWAMSAPDEFILGLLDAYLAGAGNFKQARISTSSRSRNLRDGIALLLTRVGIDSHLSVDCRQERVQRNSDGTQTTASEATSCYRLTFAARDARMLLSPHDAAQVSDRLCDVRLDPIVVVREVPSTREFVYDLTVASTRNMATTNGLGLADTFHFAGVSSKNVTLGIPRIKEILTVTKNIKLHTMTVRMKPTFRKDVAYVNFFADTLPATTLSDISTSSDIVDDPDVHRTVVQSDQWMVDADILLNGEPEHSYSRFVVRIVLNRALMRVRRVTPPDVRRVLRKRLGDKAHILSSETNEVDWVVRLRFFHVDTMVTHANMSTERQAVLSHRVVNVLMETLVVCGHTDVTAATSRSEDMHECVRHGADVDCVAEKEMVVDVNGGNLVDMVACPFVDFNRCYSNSLQEIQSTLGITAAAEALYQELHDVISFDGTYVYPGHLMMVVDTMTRDGRLKPLNRFGVNREHSNALARSSYEETPEVLTEAAMFAEDSLASGVSTNIILGQRADIGTGVAQVKFHSSMLPPRMRTSAFGTKRLVKSVVRDKNTELSARVIEYTYDDDAEPLQHMEAPYSQTDDAGVAAGASNAIDSMFATECQPPFMPTVHEETTDESFVCSHPFKIHTPDASDDEDM